MSIFEKGQDVIISGQIFSYDLFMYLLAHFKEAFSHSSLTVEEAFRELDDCEYEINSSMDTRAYQYYGLLPYKDRKEVTDTIHQMIVFLGAKYCVFSEKYPMDNQKLIDELYKKYFSYFDKYVYYYIVFDEKGKLDKLATYNKMFSLFSNLPKRQLAYKTAYNMKKDNLDAFDFAMSKKTINIPEILRINEIVNQSNENKVVGYKKTNNIVQGAEFSTVDKSDVPFSMNSLLYDYDDDFGKKILLPNEPGISGKEKYERTCELFRKEALFHIRFIRIHPFEDGNGRTARIILNQHLLSQGIAPVNITDVMRDDYLKCINNYDVEGLAKLFFMSSSIQLANWVSMKKNQPRLHRRDIELDNSDMAELDGYEKEEKERNILNDISSFLF